MAFEHRIEVDRPLEEVYQALNDPDNLPRWLTGLQRVEQISGTPGEVGSTSRQIYLERGRTVELIETITAHEPRKRFAGDIAGGGMKCSMEIELVDKGDRTLVIARFDFQSKSFMMSLMMPFIKGSICKRQSGDFERFKSKIEAGELSVGG